MDREYRGKGGYVQAKVDLSKQKIFKLVSLQACVKQSLPKVNLKKKFSTSTSNVHIIYILCLGRSNSHKLVI